MSKRINLGCGDVHMEGFTNVDVRETDAADIVSDMEIYLYPLESNSVDQIEMHHAIEHLDKEAVPPLLKQVARVLRSGGFITIECPNLERIPAIVNTGVLRFLYGGQEHEHDYHRWGYTPATLKALIEDAGLSAELPAEWAPSIHMTGVKP